MGTISKEGDNYIFRQDNGEITAWFDTIEEKMELSHKGGPLYRRVFNLLVLIGLVYLALIFVNVHRAPHLLRSRAFEVHHRTSACSAPCIYGTLQTHTDW